MKLLHEAKVDNVFIGDSEATVETLKYINEYLQNHIITILCNLLSEYKHLYNKEINIRPDQPENIIRLLLPRKPNVGIRHNIARHLGSIVMQNRLAARYSGEVYLVKHDLPFEARSNVIGFVSPEYVNLFDQIDADIRIKLIPIN
ncbi:phospho-sugar glycosidase domain-containing protein [Lactobacillus crispatus]|uniref:phospho-sugar glycosidase domain-containing protein n=1 Tax=Lactobacillus crispatus TaxID=47770 RepID=UPI00356B7102